MAASIEERVVAMSFENAVFEQRVTQTLASLGKLDTAVKNINGTEGLENLEKAGSKVSLKAPLAALDKLREKLGRSGQGAEQGLGDIERAGNKVHLEQPNKALDKTQAKMDQLSAGKTFSDIEKASQQVELSGITKAIDSVSGKFGMLQQAASVAMGNIVSQAAMKGASFAKGFAFGPINQGLEEYQTNMNSIQTIMANTEGQKVSGLEAVNAHLDELNTYADQTKYNFSEMAKNIGTFTAAGVDLPKATASIKGIANLAAISGSNSQQASTAMYQLSQSIAAGKVGLQDWNSVVNAGMGGAVFQKALMRTAENMGTVEKGAVKIDKATGKATVNGESFRNSIMAKPGEESWLTSDVLTDTLAQLTGDMTKAELVAKGYSDAQAEAIMKQADTAKRAATEVKTLPEVWDVARESIGSGWAKTFQLIFGDFEESKKLFTNMSNFINGWIGKVSDARNELLAGWKLAGGRMQLLQGLENAFKGIMTWIKPVKEAFQEIFPPTTVKELLSMTKAFAGFAKSIAIDESTQDNIKRTFAGIFAVFNIAKEIIKGVIGVVFDLIGAIGKGGDGFLGFTANIGDFLVSINEAITSGNGLKKFFEGLSTVLQKPVELLRKLIGYIADLFDGGDKETGLQEQAGRMVIVLTPLEKLIIQVRNAWRKLVDGFGAAKDALEPWFSLFVEKISHLGEMIGDAFANLKFDDIMKGVQTGLLAGLLLMIKDLFGKGGGLMEELSNTLGGVQELLGGVTGQLDTMQKKVQAQIILSIAAAVVALAGGVFILSTIDGDKLAKAMTAVAVGLGELMGAMKLMAAGTGKFGALMLPVIALGIIGLAVAITILGGALKIFATMSWDDIARGLSGIAGSLGVIAGAMRLMPPGPTMVVQAGALFILGVALNAIAVAVKSFAGMKWDDLGKGLFGLVDALGILAFTMALMPPNMIVTAAGILVLSFALIALSGAVKKMGEMDLWTIVKGIGAIGGALILLAAAMWLMPPHMIAMAAGLVLVGVALVGIAKAIEIMGNMGVWGIIKGLGALAGALILLSAGLYLMIGTLPGSAALLVAAAAIAILAPAIGLLGNMKWSTIGKGLLAIAGGLTVIAVFGLLAAPALAALGIALIPLGLGFLMVAGAAKLFASAMALLSDTGQKGVAVFLTAITGFIAILPGIVISFIKGLLSIVEEIVKIAPKIIEAIGKILVMVINFVQEQAAPLALAIGTLVDAILLVILENTPKLIAAGYQMLMNLLNGLSQNIGQIVDKVSEIITKFLEALRNNMPKLIEAGSQTLRKFLDGVGSRFGEIATSVGNLISKFIAAVGSQATKIATAAGTMMGKFIAAIATYGARLVSAGAEAILDFMDGMAQKIPELLNKGLEIARKVIKGISQGLVEMVNIGFDAIIDFLNGMAEAIRSNDDQLIDAGANILDALVDGLVKAAGRAGPAVKRAITGLFGLLPGWAKDILGIKSPSKVFYQIGQQTIDGMTYGILSRQGLLTKATQQTVSGSIEHTMGAIFDAMGEEGKALKKAFKKMGGDTAMGWREGYMLVGEKIPGEVGQFFQETIYQTQKTLGIHSPSEVFRDIGMNVNRGFRDGLMGSRDEVISAFEDMNSTLIDKIRDLRGQVAEGNGRLEDLQTQHAEKMAEIAKARQEKKPDNEAIASLVKESKDLEQQINSESAAVNQNGKALQRAREIRASLTGSMADEKKRLLGLKTEYEAITKQLEAAETALTDAQKSREDAQKKYTDSYSAKPDVDKLVADALADAELTYAERAEKERKAREEAEKRSRIDQVALYKKALQEQIVATVKYQATLQKLKELGLDDETYSKLLDKGLEGQEFAEQLLRSGKSGIDQINKLNAEMLAKSTDLAKQAADNLYSAGINAAQGLVDGLTKRKAELEAAMTSLANVMVNQIKAKLKIKSPSRVFAEVGKYVTEGLTQGLQDTRGVEGAVINLGRTMTDKLSAMVSDNIDASPVITPVLDISQLKKDAEGMSALSNVIPITAATSYGMGAATSQEVSATQLAALEAAYAAQGPSISLEQNNYSPEALDVVEVYRNTKNQMGQLKSALGVPT